MALPFNVRGGGRVQGQGVSANEAGFFRALPTEQLLQQISEDGEVVAKFERMGLYMQEEAQREATEETGAMKASIRGYSRVRDGKIEAVVSINEGGEAEYWPYQEYGTGRRGAESDQPLPLAQGYAHNPEWPGVPAVGFMRRALLRLAVAIESGEFDGPASS